MNVQFPRFLRPFWGKVVWRKKTSSKVIYLTFDDGSVPEVTPLVLDILDKYELKATFFCVGENVEKHPDVYADVLRRGHKTGNHTYNHLKGYSFTTKEFVANVRKASQIIESNLFRPPHGQITLQQIRTLKSDYKIIMWDIITHDYNKNLSPETILNTIKKHTRCGSIVVFHDSIKAKENMLSVLPLAIEWWLNEGYAFGVL
jgi:peptidoglycan/xylan/chitin deacetylase (PgdA/CDA1 family)